MKIFLTDKIIAMIPVEKSYKNGFNSLLKLNKLWINFFICEENKGKKQNLSSLYLGQYLDLFNKFSCNP